VAHIGTPEAKLDEFINGTPDASRSGDPMTESVRHTACPGVRNGPNKWPCVLTVVCAAFGVTASCSSADDRDRFREPDSSADLDSSGAVDNSADQQVAVPCTQGAPGLACPSWCDFCAPGSCPYKQVCFNHGCHSCVDGYWQFIHTECDCFPDASAAGSDDANDATGSVDADG